MTKKFNTRDLSRDEIRRLFNYDEVTGNLIWCRRPRSDFNSDRGWKVFNSRDAGNVAGSSNWDGYRLICINGKRYLAHRLIYILHHGSIPAGMTIDHIDGNPSNNFCGNLRLATQSENLRNRGVFKNNQSGIKGVSFCAKSGFYRAQIRANGKNIHLGYGTLAECSALYEEAANKYHGDFARIA